MSKEMNPEALEMVRKKTGQRCINLIEKIGEMLKNPEKLDVKQLEKLNKELMANTNLFGKLTYPFWDLNKLNEEKKVK